MPRTLNLTAEEKIQRIKDQDKVRQERRYARDKVKILASRKIARDNKCQKLLHALGMDEINLETNKQSVNVIAKEIKEHIIEEDIVKKFNPKTHNDHMKTVAKILGRSDWDKAFVNFKDVIQKIESAVHGKKNKPYKTNPRRSYFQAILTEVDKVKVTKDGKKIILSPEAREAYTNIWKLYGVRSSNEAKAKRESEEVMDFDEYVEDVIKYFGKDSKEALVIAIYRFHMFRDNLVLKIIPKEIIDKSENYLIVPENKTSSLTLVLNDYKTADKYGQKELKMPQILSNEIRKYMADKKLGYNDYLFGESKLSSFISNFNKKLLQHGYVLGFKITINTLRQMKASQILSNNPTEAEHVALSEEMHHSESTSLLYQRKIKKKPIDTTNATIDTKATKTKTVKKKQKKIW